MPSAHRVGRIVARVLIALSDHPRAAVMAVVERTGLSRYTVQARLSKLDDAGVLRSFERRIDPAVLGCPLQAYMLTNVTQRKLDRVGAALDAIPEVLEVHELSGMADLLVHVAARDADDLYRIAGGILNIEGVKRTTTVLVMWRWWTTGFVCCSTRSRTDSSWSRTQIFIAVACTMEPHTNGAKQLRSAFTSGFVEACSLEPGRTEPTTQFLMPRAEVEIHYTW